MNQRINILRQTQANEDIHTQIINTTSLSLPTQSYSNNSKLDFNPMLHPQIIKPIIIATQVYSVPQCSAPTCPALCQESIERVLIPKGAGQPAGGVLIILIET